MKQETPQSGYEEGFVEAAGARIHYLHSGSGQPMLLIHGLVGSSRNWRSNIEGLSRRASVYAIDLVNMGKSQRVGTVDPGLRAAAHRIVAVMDALDLAEADIVAHSHGGAIALMLAALHPERVRRLILFAPANPYSRSGDPIVRTYSTTWGGLIARMFPYFPLRIQRRALGEIYGGADCVVESCLHEIVHGLRDPVTLRHVLRTVRCWFSERARLKAALRRVRSPMLLVWGDRDYTVSLSSAVRLKRKLRGSELVVLPGVGHASFEEAPEQANRIVLEWLERHPWSIVRTRPALPAVPIASRNRASAAVRHLSPET
jgi:4,5:9,10-diseco-3-hydroxy-5,9,17-trioxoandrosta-1(10),2-diene-4-oate hydrolase